MALSLVETERPLNCIISCFIGAHYVLSHDFRD